ncbi:MAG TPA: Ppx/GppA family phosphatase [Proteobacteria bacterium]|nr:guanosine-5'-triphosphate,3'-diphosphate pyrophosphatase [bacterium BMS3Abin14]HDL53997.1 Ppx/GppA family phosphatase [Pseudomonadota bacterium]
MNVAAFDIGTNTIRCLVARSSGDVLEPLKVFRRITRLGKGLSRNRRLLPGPVDMTLRALEDFSRELGNRNVARARAVGTSALRDAPNGAVILEKAEDVLGFPLEVISGEEEAHLTALGVQGGIGRINDGMVIDIGGGSTEAIRIISGAIQWWRSMPVGVVHLTEACLRSDPPLPEEIRRMRRKVERFVSELPSGGKTLAATAGTPTTLAALDLGIDEYDPTLVNGHVLSLDRISELTDALIRMKIVERSGLPGMEEGREDLIPAGSMIVRQLMKHWGMLKMTVSDWGLLEGVAMEAAKGRGYLLV